ncbi:hypothetical protein BV20DRAFT_973785 [Pilatotrama ljubarskyi]|nr:hypothetical protein BV20DRAFT_973785 [Pilatotrama ljubarskyi]
MENQTNAELRKLITQHLRTQAARYSNDPKFAGLYTAANGLSSAQKRALPADLHDENCPPPPRRRRLSHDARFRSLSPAAPSDDGSSSSPPPPQPEPDPSASPSRSQGTASPAVPALPIPIDPALLVPDPDIRRPSTPPSTNVPLPSTTPRRSTSSPSRWPLSDLSPIHTSPNRQSGRYMGMSG